ncbi:MAG TPA: hypothetical protein VFL56_05205 [Solirubrobacterales bacterium]|nr:hypothetical protein [Solirubrobacterales bacterium]
MDEFAPCPVCSRSPLVGELVTVFARDGSEVRVCDQCVRKPRARSVGEPVRRERVRSEAGAATVQRTYPRPVSPQIARHLV